MMSSWNIKVSDISTGNAQDNVTVLHKATHISSDYTFMKS